MDDLITPTEAAQIAGVHAVTVRRWIRAGILPAARPSPRVIRVRRSDVIALVTPSDAA